MQLDWFLVAILTLGESVHPLGKSSGHQQALLFVPGRLLKTTAVEKKAPASCRKAIDTRLLGLTFQVRLVSFGFGPQKKRPTKKVGCRWETKNRWWFYHERLGFYGEKVIFFAMKIIKNSDITNRNCDKKPLSIGISASRWTAFHDDLKNHYKPTYRQVPHGSKPWHHVVHATFCWQIDEKIPSFYLLFHRFSSIMC